MLQVGFNERRKKGGKILVASPRFVMQRSNRPTRLARLPSAARTCLRSSPVLGIPSATARARPHTRTRIHTGATALV